MDVAAADMAAADAAGPINAGGGQFTPAGAPALATGTEIDDGPVLLFDADGDGKNDLLVTKGGNSPRPVRRSTSPGCS